MSDERKSVLALVAHPDDSEILCGGTLILLAKAGWDVHIATFSVGNCGSMDLSPNAISITRRNEAHAAAKRIGATYHCLNGLDLQIYDDDSTRSAACALLREIDPDCVITHYPVDYMPDHTTASAIARCAVFIATMPNYVVGPAAALKPTSQVVPLYYLKPLGGTDYFGNPVHPDFCVDITSVADDKAEALSCHASQREWLREQHGIDQYIEETKHWDSEAGSAVGVKYAEQFFIHKGHAYPQTPLIQEGLGKLVVVAN